MVLDEAHAARRANQVEGEFNSPTLTPWAPPTLQATGQAKGFLLLSATPMQTHPWEPWDLLQVLGEGGLWLSGFHVVRDYYGALAALERGACTKTESTVIGATLSQTDPRRSPGRAQATALSDTEAFTKALTFLPADKAGPRPNGSALLHLSHSACTETHDARCVAIIEMGLLDRPPPRRVVSEEPFDFADQLSATYTKR